MQRVIDVPEEGQTHPAPDVTHHRHRQHRHHRRRHRFPKSRLPLTAVLAIIAVVIFCLLGPLGIYKSVVEWLAPGDPIAPEPALSIQSKQAH
jgi:hypothetical protein